MKDRRCNGIYPNDAKQSFELVLGFELQGECSYSLDSDSKDQWFKEAWRRILNLPIIDEDEQVFTPTKYSEWQEISVLDEPRLAEAMTSGQSHPANWEALDGEFTATFPNLDQVKKEAGKWYRRTAL